ncbi:calcium-binding protein [Anabaena sp. FACHB-1250]|uniref:calcium-binding protein n=1 Tax=Anabaena sp. FACHB-1250 TaxID=2692770 RepID=UPI002714A7C9|nr:calcium-binding protein [Anabaena sp. FACHB-1250]
MANLNHTYPDDIDVLLVSPTGANSILMSDAGDSDDINNVTLTFDATATSSLPDSAISSGTYRPTNYYDGDFFDSPAPAGPHNADFSVFNGTNLNGEWRLYIFDGASGDVGNVAGGWFLSIETDPGDDSNNNLQGTIVDDIITGLGGDDTLVGGAGNDTLDGGAGNDTLDGGAGVDSLVGGAGVDVYIVDNTYEIITENANDGVDTINTIVTYILRDALNVENLTLLDGAINGTGNAANNVITGNSAANILNGGAGNDTLIGGAGNDTYYVDNTADIITEVDNGGNDSVLTDANYALSESVENLTLQGTATINGTGNAANNIITGNSAANTLTGNAGNDTLNGGAGNDTLNGGEGADTLNGGTGIDSLIGGAGNDIYYVDNTADIITEVDNGGNDSVLTDANYALSNSVENLTLQGTATINGTGNAANNFITGNSAANTLTGNAGNDTLNGGAGNDILTGGVGKDTLTGGLGVDRFDYRTLADSVFSNFDVITDFNATTGNDLLVVSTVTSFYDAGAVAIFSTSEIAKNLPATVFTANSAAQFTLGTGANIRTFVAINDATAGFNATTDAIIEVRGLTSPLGLNNFTTALV